MVGSSRGVGGGRGGLIGAGDAGRGGVESDRGGGGVGEGLGRGGGGGLLMGVRAPTTAIVSNRGRVSAATQRRPVGVVGQVGGGGLQGQRDRADGLPPPRMSMRVGGGRGGGLEEGDRRMMEEEGRGREGGVGVVFEMTNMTVDRSVFGGKRGRGSRSTRGGYGGYGGGADGGGGANGGDGGREGVGGGGRGPVDYGRSGGGDDGRGMNGGGQGGVRKGSFGGGRGIVHGEGRNMQGVLFTGQGGMMGGVRRGGGYDEHGGSPRREDMGGRVGDVRYEAGHSVRRDGDWLIIDRAVKGMLDGESTFVEEEDVMEGEFGEEPDEGFMEDYREGDDLLEEEEKEVVTLR